MLLRPIWVFPVRFLAIRPGPDRAGRVPSWRSTAIISWAGMRGVVTLAAVFALPEDTPQREVLVLIAMVVTAGTLMLQGFSLPWLARRLGVHGPDPREDALQEATVLQAAVSAGLRHLDKCADEIDAQTMDALRQRVEQRVNIVVGAAGQQRLHAGDAERGLPAGPVADAPCRAGGGAAHPRRRRGRPRGARRR